MKETQEIRDARAAYRKQVDEIAASGAYKSIASAGRFIEVHLGWAWRSMVGVPTEDDAVVDILKMTPTMQLVVHLFAKAVLWHGTAKSKAPVFQSWAPLFDVGAGIWRAPRAIAKRDIAKVTGKSIKAVEEAIARLRGKSGGSTDFFEKRLAFPAFVDTGIMLDVATSPQCAFAFMRDDYEYMGRHAIDARMAGAETSRKQRDWASEASATLADSAPESGRVDVAAKRSA